MNSSTRLTLIIFIILISIIGLIVILKSDNTSQTEESVSTISNPNNTSYLIDGTTYTFKDGEAESAQIFGLPTNGDLDNDGDMDAAVFIVTTGGGSGSFYYAALSLNENGTYKSTNALFLGDRIAPQNIEIKEGRAVFNYADRRADEPMTAQPSVGKSLWVHIDPATKEIGELVKDFEGEADSNLMSLTMKPWKFLHAEYASGAHFMPKKSEAFVLTFQDANRFSATTDCNGMGGSYTQKGGDIVFGEMMSTQMYCEGSQESEFGKLLSDAKTFEFTSKGELILKNEAGTNKAYFR